MWQILGFSDGSGSEKWRKNLTPRNLKFAVEEPSLSRMSNTAYFLRVDEFGQWKVQATTVRGKGHEAQATKARLKQPGFEQCENYERGTSPMGQCLRAVIGPYDCASLRRLLKDFCSHMAWPQPRADLRRECLLVKWFVDHLDQVRAYLQFLGRNIPAALPDSGEIGGTPPYRTDALPTDDLPLIVDCEWD
jgi:hypothetical protein